MRAFYERCFGLAARHVAADSCVLESAAWQLSLVVVPEAIAAEIAITTPPRRRESGAVKLAFAVHEISQIRAVAIEFGGLVDPDATLWELDGFVRCDGIDPEGNVFQLLEPLAAGS